MQYQAIDSYFVGLADLTIREIFEHYPEFFQGLSLLITSLDSQQNLLRYGEWLKTNNGHWDVQIVGHSVWVDARNAKDFLVADNGLSHFDEIYLLRRKPVAEMQINEVFTSDRCDFSKIIPPSFIRLVKLLDASRYLSDGCGLNFACTE